MKLVTFQSYEALKFLITNGYLVCDEKYVSLKSSAPYEWVIKKMNQYVKNEENIKYPVWAWVKCFNGICPPKIKGDKIKSFYVKITFNKNDDEVFVTDFEKFSFLLNNTYLPKTMQEKIEFDNYLKANNITQEELKAVMRRDKYHTCREDEIFVNTCKIIEKSFDNIISKDGKILQGCVWKLNLTDVEKIEFMQDDGYAYGSLNYIRKNSERFNWLENHYKKLK